MRMSWLINTAAVAVMFGAGLATWSAQSAQEAASAKFLPLAISLNALMVGTVDDAAHEIWDGGNTDKVLTEQQWQRIEEHAIQLQAVATLVSLGGTGRFDKTWVANPDWQSWVAKLQGAGMKAMQAMEKKDQKALRQVGDNLTEVCEGCHKQFKPDLPSEGIMHVPHYPN